MQSVLGLHGNFFFNPCAGLCCNAAKAKGWIITRGRAISAPAAQHRVRKCDFDMGLGLPLTARCGPHDGRHVPFNNQSEK